MPTEAGRFANLKARPARATRARADLLLDLHANCWQPAGDGYMIFVPHPGRHLSDYRYGPLPAADDPVARNDRYRACLHLAGIVDGALRRLAAAGGIPPYPPWVIRGSGFKVIGYTTMPAILLEVGAMDRKNDMTRLASAAYRERLAAVLARAITVWAADPSRPGRRIRQEDEDASRGGCGRMRFCIAHASSGRCRQRIARRPGHQEFLSDPRRAQRPARPARSAGVAQAPPGAGDFFHDRIFSREFS